MQIALTGATGFVGRYIAHELAGLGHRCRAWYRPTSDRGGFTAIAESLDWVAGDLGNPDDCQQLVAGCEAVVHAALYHPGGGFRGGEGDLLEFVRRNVLGTLELIEAARAGGAKRFVLVSTCAVHEKILDDRPLDETHPTWATSHYGAHKAALEQFVYSYGLGQNYPLCALRPSAVYGVARPIENSKWHSLVQQVIAGRSVECRRGGKEVHALDVARAIGVLLSAPAERIAGQVFNCCDRYVAELEVAQLAKEISGSASQIAGTMPTPKHLIVCDKLRRLGFEFGGRPLVEQTVRQLVAGSPPH